LQQVLTLLKQDFTIMQLVGLSCNILATSYDSLKTGIDSFATSLQQVLTSCNSFAAGFDVLP
jgi:hypothetical protein